MLWPNACWNLYGACYEDLSWPYWFWTSCSNLQSFSGIQRIQFCNQNYLCRFNLINVVVIHYFRNYTNWEQDHFGYIIQVLLAACLLLLYIILQSQKIWTKVVVWSPTMRLPRNLTGSFKRGWPNWERNFQMQYLLMLTFSRLNTL